jgi:hypothetical protein
VSAFSLPIFCWPGAVFELQFLPRLPNLEERLSLLQDALDQTDELARAGQLPDVELNSAGLKISPIENNVPKEADALKEALYGMLQHVKITDLLMEVDHWTGFTRHFVHLKTTDPAKDPILLLNLFT